MNRLTSTCFHNFKFKDSRFIHKLSVIYDQYVSDGVLKDDKNQRNIVNTLVNLDTRLQELKSKEKPNFFQSFSLNKSNDINKGLYIYGGVGCGKTMLMDMFYESCTETAKRRIHFHEFMIEVHKEMHKIKKTIPKKTDKASLHFDPIPLVANIMVGDNKLLCFDEFQVTDIADAMILKILFENIFKKEILVVATSNRHPDDLYKNGLQRINFLPFIDLLKIQCEVLCMDSDIDYRRMTLPKGQPLYLTSHNSKDPEIELEEFFKKLTDNQEIGPASLTVFGRTIKFDKACDGVLYSSFKDLCENPLSASDYLEISHNFHTIFLSEIPKLSLTRKGRLRRFITLIDALYDNDIRLVCSAAEDPEMIFEEDADCQYDLQAHRMLMDDLGIKQATPTPFGEEEKFARDRLISRLFEMRTEEYWNSSKHPLLL